MVPTRMPAAMATRKTTVTGMPPLIAEATTQEV